VYAWYLSEKKNTPAKAYAPGNLNRETEFILKKFKVETPEKIESVTEKDKIIIIDTTNPDELIEGVDKAEIVEIIDHHKLAGGLSTPGPISITVRPVACCATILWRQFKREGNDDIPMEIAGLLLSAVLSDTLKFTSPTTTDEDKEASEELAKIVGVDIDQYCEEMFEAKSDLSGMNEKDVVLIDSKVFDLAGKKIRISVLETTKVENALLMKDGILSAMCNIAKEEMLDGIFFYIVDILKSEATLLVPDKFEIETAQKAHDCEIKDNQAKLPGVVSRKKQIVPNLEKALS